ncbi:type II secretion system protein GspL [uncultured Tateyamaria sp.]|uniref:type II secretion system protein GspL n=1 Tax=uncultured Tateyamaria sp. TaxID=455651 RepID=UPI00262A2B38|nr:type II secretion system protein GspL [uncultured Tateyamaria sp.]
MTVLDPFGGKNTEFVHVTHADGPLSARQVLVVPGAEVATVTLDLPDRLRGQTREDVARRQLRDRFGLDGDSAEMRPFHLRGGSDRFDRVLVADSDRIEAWRAQAGPQCRAVLPDYLALPVMDDAWTMCATPDGVAVRLGPDDGFGAGLDVALVLLDTALANGDTPRAVHMMGAPVPEVAAWATAHDIPVTEGNDVTKALAGGEVEMDLRRDPRRARDAVARRWMPWRYPVLLGTVAAGLWAASQYVIVQRIAAETAQINASTTALVQEHFVASGPVLDARVQVTRALNARRTGTTPKEAAPDPLDTLNRAALVLAAQGADTRAARYSANDGLNLVVGVSDFAAADRLAAALRDAGLGIDVVDTRADENSPGVRAEMRVTDVAEVSE